MFYRDSSRSCAFWLDRSVACCAIGGGGRSRHDVFKRIHSSLIQTSGNLLNFDEGTLRIELRKFESVEQQTQSSITHELMTIDYLLSLCLRAMCATEGELQAAKILAQNIEDALVAGFLSAALLRLRDTWEKWRESWFSEVRPRVPATRPSRVWQTDLPKFSSLIHPTFGLTIDRRRSICLRDYDGEPGAPNVGRRFHVNWSQALAYACEAFRKHGQSCASSAQNPPSESAKPVGRRVFVLAGPRGAGKGQFFSALTERSGLLGFLEASWSGRTEREPYVGAYAFNLSFSVEFGSGFDRLIRFLHECIRRDCNNDPGSPTFDEQFSKIVGDGTDGVGKLRSGNRIGALQFLLRVLAGRVPGLTRPTGRFVLLFNASHLLFTRAGYSKSADVTRIMSALLSSEFAAAALDCVLITDERGIPIEFREHGTHSPSAVPTGYPFRESPPCQWDLEVVHSVVDPLRNEPEDEIAIRKLRLRLATPNQKSDGTAAFLRLQPSLLGVRCRGSLSLDPSHDRRLGAG